MVSNKSEKDASLLSVFRELPNVDPLEVFLQVSSLKITPITSSNFRVLDLEINYSHPLPSHSNFHAKNTKSRELEFLHQN